MAIVTVPQLSDNYAYLVIDDGSKECAVVDCAEADKVLDAVKRDKLILDEREKQATIVPAAPEVEPLALPPAE